MSPNLFVRSAVGPFFSAFGLLAGGCKPSAHHFLGKDFVLSVAEMVIGSRWKVGGALALSDYVNSIVAGQTVSSTRLIAGGKLQLKTYIGATRRPPRCPRMPQSIPQQSRLPLFAPQSLRLEALGFRRLSIRHLWPQRRRQSAMDSSTHPARME